MRFHVVSVPFTHTTDDFSSCAFTEKTRKFCMMMHSLGHEVYLYAGQKNEAPCTEHIYIVNEQERLDFLGQKHYTQGNYDFALPFWRKFNAGVAKEIGKRKQPKDFICIISGRANQSIEEAHPELMTVEFGIGYQGSYAKYRVFESYAWMHATYAQQAGNHDTNGFFYHDVIPSYFETHRFDLKVNKGEHLLFVGRLTERKGIMIAEQLAKETGRPLHVAGTGDLPPPADCVYHGVVGWRERNRIMGEARALICPTIYLEPFGSVAVEAQLCGTPAITTDWGAFPETVEHGVSGYRCRTMQEFVDAVDICHTLSPYAIRQRAVRKYSLEAVARMYDRYFHRLATLWGDGFYEKGWTKLCTSTMKTDPLEATSATVTPLAMHRRSGTT